MRASPTSCVAGLAARAARLLEPARLHAPLAHHRAQARYALDRRVHPQHGRLHRRVRAARSS
eukprot:4150472-Prymnesium_polylepis.1